MKTSHRRAHTSLQILLAAGLGASVFCAPAQAQTLNWNNVAGGSAGTAANWNPAQIPSAANLLVWNLANTFTTTFPGTVPQSASQTFKRGVVTLSVTSPHTTTSFVRVGDVSGDSATTILSSGTLHAGTGVSIGNSSGAAGTLTVDNEGSLLDTTAAGSDVVVGNGGTGTLNITDGASVVPIDDLIVGSASTAVGHVTVTGTGGLPLPIPSSTLDLTGTGKDVTIGLSGDGFLDVLSGGRVNADEMFVGLNPGSSGVVNVGGIGGILNSHSQINIATSLHLGDNPGVGLNGGSATFSVNDGGIINVSGTTRIGDPTGVGSGTLTVNAGGLFTTNSLVATDSGGFLNLLGGQLRIDGGGLTTRNDVLVVDGTVSAEYPAVGLLNGASCTLSAPVAPFEALVLGNGGHGTFNIESGSHLTISSGDVILGNLAGGFGQFVVGGGGSSATMASTRVLVIGDAGTGSCFVQSAGHLATGSVILGRTGTGAGTADVENAGVWDVSGSLLIGGTANAAFGTGTVHIGALGGTDSTINITSGGVGTTSVEVWGAGDSLTVGSGGALIADGSIHIHSGAGFSLDGGTIESTDLHIDPPSVNARGTIRGQLSIPAASNVISLSGDLLVTDGLSSVALIANFGRIEIGDHALSYTSTNLNQRGLNSCHLGASGMLTSPMSLVVGANSTLSGDGVIDAPINNQGFVVSEGSGLTFRKVLSGIGQGVSGTTITFGNGGGFTGSGIFSNATPITTLNGSVITATGNLTMGTPSSSSGFSGSAGRIVVAGDFDVTLLDSLQAIVCNIDFPNTGVGSPSVKCSTGLGVAGTVTGTGTIAGDFDSPILVTGAISPGLPGAVGIVSLAGDTAFDTGTTIAIDIENATTHDQITALSVSGPNFPFTFQSDITLNGTLLLRVNPAHTPTNGEEHTIIRGSGVLNASGHIFGSFQSVNAPPHWIVYERNPNFGLGPDLLVAVYCPADFNGDSTVDFFDYLDFVDALSAGAAAADFNNDGVIDFFDYLDFVDAFSTGC